jgi:hypothetical protein
VDHSVDLACCVLLTQPRRGLRRQRSKLRETAVAGEDRSKVFDRILLLAQRDPPPPCGPPMDGHVSPPGVGYMNSGKPRNLIDSFCRASRPTPFSPRHGQASIWRSEQDKNHADAAGKRRSASLGRGWRRSLSHALERPLAAIHLRAMRRRVQFQPILLGRHTRLCTFARHRRERAFPRGATPNVRRC